MASIEKYRTKDGDRYAVRWRDHSGQQRWQAAGPRRKDAERIRVELERRLLLGPLYQAPPETLGAFLEGWRDRYRQKVRPSTFRRCLEALPHLAPLEPLLLEQITFADVDDLVHRVARDAPRQAEIALAHLKQVLREARERGQVVDDALFRVRLGRRDRRETRFLTWAEVDELAHWTAVPYGNLVRLAALTGLRQGELFALTDRNVDRAAGVLRVTHTATETGLTPPKTRASRRTVSLSDHARRIVLEQLAAREPTRNGLVFPSPDGHTLHKSNFNSRVFRPAVKRARLDGVRFHDLRHTYAALMIAAGAPVKLLQDQMGHTSARITLDLYGHLYPTGFADIGHALDRLIDQEVDEGQAAR
ncbi:MAG: site-specific integrase [Thermoleophilia bacterium]